MTNVTVYFKNSAGKNEMVKYRHVTFIKAGTALQVLGETDARYNGLSLNAPMVQLIFDDGNTATFDADRITLAL